MHVGGRGDDLQAAHLVAVLLGRLPHPGDPAGRDPHKYTNTHPSGVVTLITHRLGGRDPDIYTPF